MTPPTGRRRPDPSAPSGVWRATVARAAPLEVVVDRLAGARTFRVLGWADTLDVTATGVAGDPAHAHTVTPAVAAGDRVLVAFVEGRPNDLVILCRLA